MFRVRSIFKYSQIDQSLNTFLKKYKASKQQDKIQNTNQTLVKGQIKIQGIDDPQVNNNQKQDPLKEKYLLSKVKRIDLQDKSTFSHYNRPQELQIKKIDEDKQKENDKVHKLMKEQMKGQEFVDSFQFPEEFLNNMNRIRNDGVDKLEQAYNSKYGIDDGFYKQYATLEEWKEVNKLETPLIDRLKIEKIKPYPGTSKGSAPFNDPEGFTCTFYSIIILEWFNENHSPQLQQLMADTVEQYTSTQKKKKRNVQQALNDLSQPTAEVDEDISSLVCEGTLPLYRTTQIESLIEGDPLEDLARNNSVSFRSTLDQDEIEPVPQDIPFDHEELCYLMERWTLFRMIPNLQAIKNLENEGQETQEKEEPMKIGSLNTYYQTLPKHVREDSNVKNAYRGLEWHNPQLTMKEREKALNMIARYAEPLTPLAEDISTQLMDNYKPHPTRFDQERLIDDQEQEVVDPAINPEATQKYLDQRTLIKEGGPDDWPLPDWQQDKKERVDDLPVDYYINDDGFWDDYIKEKEQRQLSNSPLAGSKLFYKHI